MGVRMRSAVLISAVIGLTCATPPVFAAEWVLVDGQTIVAPRPNGAVYYLDLSGVSAAGPEKEFEIAKVESESAMTFKPRASSLRYRIDCTWRVVSTGPWKSLDPASAPSTPAEERWSSPAFPDEAPVRAAEKVICDGDGPAGERLPGNDAMLADGLKRLGFADAASAFALPRAPAVVRPAPFRQQAPFPDKAPDSQTLIHDQSAASRAVFLTPSTLQRDGQQVYGRSVWLSGAGKPAAERSYAYRYFEADCTQGAIAFESAAVFPTGRSGVLPKPGQRVAVPSARRPPAAGSPAASVLQAACSGAAPLKQVASFSELLAYAENPAEDPAFMARRQVTIGHSDMRWQSAPTAADVSAALPPGALKPGEKGKTTIKCLVTRTYDLSECAITYHDPWDRKLGEAQLSLVGKYIPARESITGEDTAGHWVESSAQWSNEGSSLQPVTIAGADMRWIKAPSTAEFRKSYRGPKPAEAFMECRITPEYTLADCRIPFWKAGPAAIGNLLSRNKQKDPVADANQAFGKALLSLAPKFTSDRVTSKGENPAGQKVLLHLAAP
jgi:hypothetical protein